MLHFSLTVSSRGASSPADDPRCLQLVEENYVAVALCAWALKKTVL
jgi:hypothetical protein